MPGKLIDMFGRPLSIDKSGGVQAAGPAPVADPRVQFRLELPPMEIPKVLQPDLDANSKLIPEFFNAVAKTLMICLQHPTTRPRVFPPTTALLKEWVELCYHTLTIMREDMGFSLHRCFGILPAKVFEAIRRGIKPEDHIEKSEGEAKAWTTEHPGIEQQPQEFVTAPVDVDSDEAKEILANMPEVVKD